VQVSNLCGVDESALRVIELCMGRLIVGPTMNNTIRVANEYLKITDGSWARLSIVGAVMRYDLVEWLSMFEFNHVLKASLKLIVKASTMGCMMASNLGSLYVVSEADQARFSRCH
jgi:hypothetical protein